MSAYRWKTSAAYSAVQFTGGNRDEILRVLGVECDDVDALGCLNVTDARGNVTHVCESDWIVTHRPSGTTHARRPGLFEACYEEVAE